MRPFAAVEILSARFRGQFLFVAVITFLKKYIVFPVFTCILILFSSLPHSWPVPQLEPSQIRLIVYQDCERRGRNVLFDSSTMKRGPEETPFPVSYAFTSLNCAHSQSLQMGLKFQFSVIYSPDYCDHLQGIFRDHESVPSGRVKLR